MTYKINGTDFLLAPESGEWLPREYLGTDGNGRHIYAPTRRFEVQWGFLTPAQFKQMQDFFEAIPVTGSLVVDLPEYNAATYQFNSYTGCYLREPVAQEYFQEHISRVTLTITNIRT
jgi:hypothetical protein